MQLIGFAYLSYYIYHTPTWSGALDAMAIARIGASLGQKDVLPLIGPVGKQNYEALNNVDSLVGISKQSSDFSDIEMQRVGRKGPCVNI